MNSNWLEVRVKTTPEGIEPLSDYLIACDVGGLSIEDGEDFKRFLAENEQYWDYVDEDLSAKMKDASYVIFYITEDEYGMASLGRIRAGFADFRARCKQDLGELSVTFKGLKEEDWENGWKQYYKPLPVGARLLIVPEWERESAEAGGRVPLYLNPGLTFGTGSHASTQLCLELLEPLAEKPKSLLDLGCGSGILSIAGLLLGCDYAYAVDIDPKCKDVAYENAAHNGIGKDRLTVSWGNVLADKKLHIHLLTHRWNLVLANIVADVIIPLAPMVPQLLDETGHFLCSGIIDTRADEVEQALRDAGLRISEKRERDGWVAFDCTGLF